MNLKQKDKTLQEKKRTMKAKKICILRSNPVDPDSRVEKTAYALSKNGYEVSVFGWDRESNHGLKKSELLVLGEKIPVYRIGFKASYGEGFKNLVPYLRFQNALKKWVEKGSFDTVHACDFDTARSSFRKAKKAGKRFVFDIFDFLYCNPKGFLQKIVKKTQFSLINHADATIVCTEQRIKQISGSHPKKLCVVHNTPIKKMVSTTEKHSSCDKVKVVYVGILQKYRSLEEIGEYFSENHDVELHIGGYGIYEKYFENLSNNNENIYYYGKLSYEETLELESKSDIMLALYDPSIDNHFYAAPNKFYEGLMLGKPLVMTKGMGMSDVVLDNGIGEVVDYSMEGLDSGLNRLIGKKKEWNNISEKMKKLYFENYSWDIMMERLVGLYNSLE